jgi:hypothetical protein
MLADLLREQWCECGPPSWELGTVTDTVRTTTWRAQCSRCGNRIALKLVRPRPRWWVKRIVTLMVAAQGGVQ